jgi:hypothetical protein
MEDFLSWGMKPNSGFGDYFPNGSFAEWDEQLRQFSKDGLSDERKQAILQSMRSYKGWISDAFNREIGAPWGGSNVICPLDEELPKVFRTVKSYRTLASLIQLNDGLVAVDEDLRAIIEDLEPGLHRFWPIRIQMPKGVTYPGAYFGMLVGRFLDSFMPKESNPDAFRTGELAEDIYFLRGAASDTFSGVVFDGEVIGSSHLWRERKLLTISLFLSDTLKSRIDAANLRVPKCQVVKHVSVGN